MSLTKKEVWLPYDFDTAIGINNDGEMVFDYNLEDIDHQQGGAAIFNGQDSVIWKNIRAAFFDDLATMYRSLRSSGALSYDKIEEMFEEHQDKWSEALFNEDSQFKYIEPFVNSGANYLYMLLGSKAEHRKWWLYNRFRYIDSKYVAGDARTDAIFLRPYEADDITITPYADIYASIMWDATLTQERATRRVPVTLECPYQTMNGNIVTIYSSSQLASVGDLSGLKIGQIDISNATRLQSLKIGDSDQQYENANLYSMTFGNNILLKTIDARNCTGLGDTSIQGHTQTTVDISGCSIIEEVRFDGTNIRGITLPNGGVLKTLTLPNTITSLIVRNQGQLTTFSVENNDYSNIGTLRIENCSSVIPVMDILDDIAQGSRVRLIGFTTAASGSTDAEKMADIEDFYDYLDTMRGLDENGNNVDTAQVQGTITGLGTITGAWLAQMIARYPYITIEYEHITSNLYYYNGETLYHTEQITDGGNGVYSGTPTKANSSDGHYSYAFAGWSKNTDDNTVDSNARTAVVADRNVYACYTATVRTYTVYWQNAGSIIETDTNVPWGTVPTYNGATPTNNGQTSTGWLPDPTQPITGNTTFVAQYTPIYTVSFYNGSTLLQTVKVLQGGTASYTGSTPEKTGVANPEDYTFIGWDRTLTNVQSSFSTYAQFKEPKTFYAPSFDVTGAYAVQWIYASGDDDPVLARGGAAASFADPLPATSVSGSGSSPFDNILPWSGMKRYNIINGAVSYSEDDAGFSQTDYDTVVRIPEFYFAVEKDTTNERWTWAVSPTAKSGYTKHPGSGRYVGRYHTSGDSTEVFTKSGIIPLVNTSQTNFRTYSHNKGTNWYMMDLATWSALKLLYLVEFGSFASQTVLGEGYTGFNAVGAGGGTDSAVYHTIKATRAHNQYRWVEDPFSNCRDWIDGFLGSRSEVYAGVSDSGYTGSTSGLDNTGISLPSSGAILGFGYSSSVPWAFIPDTASGSVDNAKYVTDYVDSYSSQRPANVGGGYYSSANYGFFYLYAYNNATYTNAYLGSRLQFNP